ncbi:MAG: HEPN domain-containing protein [Candidatus Methanoperedens sp.]|nr:HEPN domain-containing protein [Candidatus Methanoperedens sp.]
MNMNTDLLDIAKMDLHASEVLYENELYPQAIFYFQQSVEKANKAFALITNQLEEKDLLKEVGHQTVNIYEKSIRIQKNRYEQLNEKLGNIPEFKSTKIIENLNISKTLRQIDGYLSQIKKIKERQEELIYISKREIRQFLKDIASTKRDIEKDKRKISRFKITEKTLNKTKREIIDQLGFLSKYDPAQFEEAKKNLESTDIRLLVEKLIKNQSELLIIIIPLSMSLYYLAIITLPHASITRYPNPKNGQSPLNIYTKKLPIVKMLHELFEVHKSALNELKLLNKKFEVINAGIH